MFPQDGFGGCTPNPRKLRLASMTIAVPSCWVASTKTVSQGVRGDVPIDDPPRPGTDRRGSKHVLLLLDAERAGASKPNNLIEMPVDGNGQKSR